MQAKTATLTTILVGIAALVGTAVAQPARSAPGEESGLVESPEPGDSPARLLARGVLFVPRALIDLAFTPVELGLRTYERYQLGERVKRLLFNDAETMGVVPTARLESGFGVTLGARFVHRDLFGAGERLGVRAGAGGRYRQLHRVSLATGERLGDRISLELEGEYERRPHDPFYGIGNSDAVESRYRHQLARATAVADVRVLDDFHARVSGALAEHAITGTAAADSIDRMYPADALPGYGETRDGYGELELRFDSRRRGSAWEPAAVFGAGSLVAVHVGRSASLDAGRDLWRGGIDVQHFVRLAAGPRLVALRARAEAVSGMHDEIPFHALPRLGGATSLRGYPSDRFRDRASALGSVEYQWDVARNVSASLFVDAGRVYASAEQLSLSGLRVGYGAGLQVHTENSFLARVSVATSIDGGWFFDVALDPVFELDRRVERK